MPYRVNCPACKTACLVADESLGKKLLCGKCRQPFTVGNPKPPAPAAPKPPLPSASKAATGRTTTDLPPRPPSKAPSPRNAIQSTAALAPPPARRKTSPLLIVGILAVMLLVLGGALAGAIVAGIYFLQPRSETLAAQTPAANNEQPGQVAPPKEKADPPADAPTAPQATTEEPINPKPMPVSDNLKVIKTIPLTTYRRIHDFALHPKKKIAFLSVENTVAKVLDEPAEALRIVSINEESGEVAELPRIYGRWIAVDPEGKYLIAAYKDVFKTGEHYHLNPDWNLITIPEYGNIDMLMRYSLASGTPRLEEVLRKAGGNGQRLVLSPDGEQSAYLSFVGYPDFSRNIAAFDVVNLKKEAVLPGVGRQQGDYR